jgi:hypothetical protein
MARGISANLMARIGFFACLPGMRPIICRGKPDWWAAAHGPALRISTYGEHCERRRGAACRFGMRSMQLEDFLCRDTNGEKSGDAVFRGLSPAQLTWPTAERSPNQHFSHPRLGDNLIQEGTIPEELNNPKPVLGRDLLFRKTCFSERRAPRRLARTRYQPRTRLLVMLTQIGVK